MGDLIRRQDAIEACRSIVDNINSPTDQQIGAEYCLDLIKKIPSVEPERKRHKWVDGILYHDFDESEWEKVKCSGCGNFVIKQIFYNNNKYHFCPNCGAKMSRGK